MPFEVIQHVCCQRRCYGISWGWIWLLYIELCLQTSWVQGSQTAEQYSGLGLTRILYDMSLALTDSVLRLRWKVVKGSSVLVDCFPCAVLVIHDWADVTPQWLAFTSIVGLVSSVGRASDFNVHSIGIGSSSPGWDHYNTVEWWHLYSATYIAQKC